MLPAPRGIPCWASRVSRALCPFWQGAGLSQRACNFRVGPLELAPPSHTARSSCLRIATVRFLTSSSKMPKRKSTHAEEPVAAVAEPRRRSMRLQKTEDEPELVAEVTSKGRRKSVKNEEEDKVVKNGKTSKSAGKEEKDEPAPKKSRSSKDKPEPVAEKPSSPAKKATKKATKKEEAKEASPSPASDEPTERNYWLLKAEPETRYENGIDVKFSIDDLAAKTEPEPWDGIRNYAARNNLRAMKKGDLAFFYHSNCKEPGIAGTMEVVQEHSPDLSAHDPKAPYYDASSKPSDPKWSVVHVKFRSKFAVPITLKELKELGAAGKPLQNMQMIKQSRLSVSKVSAAEWEFLTGVAEEKAKGE
ncbi:PUA-like domain-containing protein [Apiosordaria backusii]|uniref:Thymocyte nuclear protein 1 n=1 Tax=Apiosordaria backusii TaxID=314023 RepID=A0AA39ZY36_9PEZI|nr:PUA-like domain-containing protein [Apiosordaria backusii]